jgi:zinc protease
MTLRVWVSAVCATLLAFGFGALGTARAGPPAWPQSLGDLPADPTVTFGVLPNGMRYAIRHSTTPPGQVLVRFVILAGSENEDLDQHGLAHFLEHMAFHGSTHVADGDVRATLERLGLRFGPDANAGTSQQLTMYRFDLPQNDSARVDTALMFTREIASELTLDAKLMDAERAVILNELRMRSGPNQEAAQRLMADMIGVHPYARLVGGSEAEVQAGTIQALRRFYDAYYRPERAVLVVVGDVDPSAIQAKIIQRFSDWQGRGVAGRDPPPAGPEPGGVKLEIVPGAIQSQLLLVWNEPLLGPPLTREDMQRRLAIALINQATTLRLRELTDEAGDPVGIANGFDADREQIPGVARRGVLDAFTITDASGGVTLLAHAERQLADGGLTQSELDQAIRSARTRLQAQLAGADTQASPQIAGRIVDAAVTGAPMLSPQQQLELFEAAVRDLTLEKANTLLRAELSVSAPRLIYTGPTPPTGGQGVLDNAFAKATTDPVAVYASPPARTWTHTDFGPPGRVIERQEMAEAGATFVRFANGVTLVVKHTDFAKDQFIASVQFGHGQLDLPRDRVAASDYGWLLLGGGGLTDLKPREIGEATIGHTVMSGVLMNPDSFLLTNAPAPGIASRAEDLYLQMQLFAAVITAPGWRANEWRNWMANADADEAAIHANPGSLFDHDAGPLLHSSDARWAPSTPQMRATWTPEQAEAFMRPIVERAPLQVIIVGDVTVDDAVRATAATLGALPARGPQREPADLRDVRFPPPRASALVLRHTGPADKALLVVDWPATDALANARQTQAARVLADVFTSRLFDELRVKHGWTYSPAVAADFSMSLPGYGMVAARVTSRPQDLPVVEAAIDSIAADIASNGVSADAFERAIGPRIEAAKRAANNNAYWLDALLGGQRDPRILELQLRAVADLQSLTPEDIRAAARRWLVKDRSWRIEVIPAAASSLASAR